eukprot:4751688-Lingulodinium_polyedra.AAC.1
MCSGSRREALQGGRKGPPMACGPWRPCVGAPRSSGSSRPGTPGRLRWPRPAASQGPKSSPERPART